MSTGNKVSVGDLRAAALWRLYNAAIKHNDASTYVLREYAEKIELVGTWVDVISLCAQKPNLTQLDLTFCVEMASDAGWTQMKPICARAQIWVI